MINNRARLACSQVVLAASSTYFDTILSQYQEKDPIVIMRDVKFLDLEVLVDCMYKGEVNIDHTRLSSLLKIAKDLDIKGFAELSSCSVSRQNDLNTGHSPSTGTPGVETVLQKGKDKTQPTPNKRRRDSPPLDDLPSTQNVLTPTPSNINATNLLNSEQFQQEFWKKPSTRRVMDAIKSKEFEMKTAAEILGVSYGTLYGRYRDSYGCLKHPYRVRDFSSKPGRAEVLTKLRQKEGTLLRPAKFPNVTGHTLATYRQRRARIESYCPATSTQRPAVVLSACSTYFDTILSQYEEKDPIIIIRGVKFLDLELLVQFMYKGEINIDHVSINVARVVRLVAYT
ncbi:PREDICTED: uncharacterized protein LOC105556651 [Vollenhovia emeryi]|uniref:uncharacterized protein LOC105556651 n=1 Tax=Vollenhovia emeryi TaxID=411798 RepID=UPI0005F3AE9F|nr:PREDICTED: uncharacterized protein LOC105556651 [Vollenhovia emeryi]